MTDYIPRKDLELITWSGNFTAQITLNAQAWEIPQETVSRLQAANTQFSQLLEKAISPNRSPVLVAQKNAARKELERQIRALAGFPLKNPIITNAQRVALGLRVHDARLTTIAVPSSHPIFHIEVLDFRRLRLSFHDANSERKAIPYGISGAVVATGTLDAPPQAHDALSRSVLATRTPYTLEFTEEERGKTVYIALCWQNKKGQKGPWSEISSAIIP